MSLRYTGAWMQDGAFNPLAAPPPIYTPETLWSWGYNNRGQLGLGNTTNYSSPKQVGSNTNWKTIAQPGGYFTSSIKTNGTLWSWGDNTYGQLGLNSATYSYSSPKQIGSLTNWTSVDCGFQFMAAVKTDGTLWSWGRNNYGQLGLGNTTYFSSPKQVGTSADWSNVSCGIYSSLAIKTDGTLWAWGYNGLGQLGLGNTTNYSSPMQIGALTTWSKAVSGRYFSLAIKTDGTLWGWGLNNTGQLGLGNTTNYSSPKQIGTLTNWLKISASKYGTSSIAIKTDGTLWSWGRNDYGQLGLSNTTYYSSPKQVGTLTNWSKISMLERSSCATKTDGTLWSWGRNDYGQLGLGNTTYFSSPKQVGTLTNWIEIAAGRYFSTAIQY